jgi:hypothetical protein
VTFTGIPGEYGQGKNSMNDNEKCWDCGHSLLYQPCCYKHRVNECILITKKQLKDWEKEQGKIVFKLRDAGYDVYFDLHARKFVGEHTPEAFETTKNNP